MLVRVCDENEEAPELAAGKIRKACKQTKKNAEIERRTNSLVKSHDKGTVHL